MNYQEFKHAVISYTTKYEVTDYELYYTKGEETSAEIYKDEIKGFTSASTLGICFRCILDGQTGYASTENMTLEEAESLVTRALENAKSLESETPAFIHTKGDTYLTRSDEPSTAPTAAEIIDFALSLQQAVYAQDIRVADGTQAVAGCGVSERAIFNSNGLDLADNSSFDYCYAHALVSEQNEMYTGLAIQTGKMHSFDAAEIAKEAVQDATDYIGYTSVDSGAYTIVFSNKVMANLLKTYSSVFSASSAQQGLSLLKDKEGEQVASDIVTITDDPIHKDALEKATFDDEGAATYAKNVIENGTFVTFLHNLATAKKAGVKTTGNGYKASYASPVDINHYSFYINPGEKTLEELFQETANGIYITSIEGMHAGANAITGDFSLSASGFKIENGKKSTPVKEITVSGNFLQLLKDISAIGNDLKFSPGALGAHRCGSPSVLVQNMTIAGK